MRTVTRLVVLASIGVSIALHQTDLLIGIVAILLMEVALPQQISLKMPDGFNGALFDSLPGSARRLKTAADEAKARDHADARRSAEAWARMRES